MRKTLPLLFILVTLAACSGTAKVTCESAYWDGTVGTCLPAGWTVIDRASLDERGVGPEVVVAFQSDKPYSGLFATVTVTREALNQVLTSEEYSDASVNSVATLPGYKEIDQRNVKVDGATVSLHIFTAQPRDDQPVARFYQVSAVGGNSGYTYTASTPVSVPDELEQQIVTIFSNITFVSPDGALPPGNAASSESTSASETDAGIGE